MDNFTCDILIPYYVSDKTPERITNLKRCVEQVNKLGLTPIIGGNKHPNINATYDFLRIDMEHFNKCLILNKLIKYSKKEKFFILDADLYIEDGFIGYLQTCIQPGQAYFPMCYRMNKGKEMVYDGDIDSLTDDDVPANGGWCMGGFGPLGMYKEDWDRYNFTYKLEIGESWGVEDDDIHNQIKAKMKTVRHKCPQFYHMWHPKTFVYKNVNHVTSGHDDFHKLRAEKYVKYINNTIYNKYIELSQIPSDINEHLPILKEYADKCEHVTEMGVRWVVSTWAFLASKAERIISYDLVRFSAVGPCIDVCRIQNKDWTFIEADVLKVDIEETDFLFIDTYHTAEQLKQELARHSSKVRKYIGFHDTTTFWERGEDSYSAVSELQTHSEQGLKYAIEPFLAENPEWEIVYRTEKNNGLMIIGRKNA